MRGLEEFPEETRVLKQLNAAHSELHLPPLIRDHTHEHVHTRAHTLLELRSVHTRNSVCLCAHLMLDLVFSLIGFSLFSNDMNNLLGVLHICPFFEGRCPEGFIFFSMQKRHIATHTHTQRESRCSQK